MAGVLRTRADFTNLPGTENSRERTVACTHLDTIDKLVREMVERLTERGIKTMLFSPHPVVCGRLVAWDACTSVFRIAFTAYFRDSGVPTLSLTLHENGPAHSYNNIIAESASAEENWRANIADAVSYIASRHKKQTPHKQGTLDSFLAFTVE